MAQTPYYGTQGGGTAIMTDDGRLVWETPPDGFTEALPGDLVPEQWGITGPFDRDTNKSFC